MLEYKIEPGQVETVHIVPASDIFHNAPTISDAFCNIDADFTWGDNNRSLITPERFIDHLDNIDDDDRGNMFDAVRQRAFSVADMNKQRPPSAPIYIDMEN